MAPISYFLVGATLVVGAFADLVSELRGQSGQVLVPSDATFEATRKVMNAACKAQPAVIVVPKTEQDISTILKTATKYNMEISVRSGGHSYTCTNIKEGGVHCDLRQVVSGAMCLSLLLQHNILTHMANAGVSGS